MIHLGSFEESSTICPYTTWFHSAKVFFLPESMQYNSICIISDTVVLSILVIKLLTTLELNLAFLFFLWVYIQLHECVCGGRGSARVCALSNNSSYLFNLMDQHFC